MVFLSYYGAPKDIRKARSKRIVPGPAEAAIGPRGLETLAKDAVRAAQVETVTIPGTQLGAGIVVDIAPEALAARDRLKSTDAAIREQLAHHLDAALIPSIPRMGAIPVAEIAAPVGRIEYFNNADTPDAAAGLAPVLR